ncbi:MAG: methyltransferase domain-containing protein [Deltaproteobacteria bacterium]|nr:methyltransferase domain-containing protein [Deltaproteobacteria bacterium]
MSAPSLEELRRLEREWQDRVGHELLDRPFDERGSAIVFERQFDRVVGALEGVGEGPIVEVGCGRGQLLSHLRRHPLGRDRLLVGVDVSVATRVLEGRGALGVRGDGERLPLRDGSAAAVVYNGALHHVVDPRAALREAFRVLGPRGRLVVFEPVSSAFSQLAHRLLDPLVFRASCEYESPVDQHLKHAFSEEVVEEELRRGGTIVRAGKSDFLAYPFTGCYAGALFTRSPRFMRALLAAERAAEKLPGLRVAARMLAWRFLLAADKADSGSSATAAGGGTTGAAGTSGATPSTGGVTAFDGRLAPLLACPRCHAPVAPRGGGATLECGACRVAYRTEDRVPVLLVDESTRLA